MKLLPEINLVGAGSTVVTIKADGTISADSTIQSNTNIVGGVQVSSPRVNATTELLAPDNFLADVGGLSVDNANIGNLQLTSGDFADVAVDNVVYTTEVRSNSGDVVLTASSVNASLLSGNDLTIGDATVNGTIDIGSNNLTQTTASLPTLVSTAITATNITVENLSVNTTLDAPNFSSSGAITGTTALFDYAAITDLQTVGVGSFGTIDASIANIANIVGTVSADNINANSIVVAGVATIQNLDVGGQFNPSVVTTPRVDANEVNTDEITPLTGDDISINGNLVSTTGTNTLGITTISELTVNGVRIRTPSSPSTSELAFNVSSGPSGTVLTITVNYLGTFLNSDPIPLS